MQTVPPPAPKIEDLERRLAAVEKALELAYILAGRPYPVPEPYLRVVR